jgi:predicted dehydrogenase
MKARFPSVEISTNFEEMVARPDLDAIVIATSVHLHYPMAKAALLAGKHAFIEKPMARSAAECDELVELAAARDLILMVGHTFLYSPHLRKIRDIIENGDIGELRYISCRRLNLGLFQKDINVAWDLAPHDISMILHILGEQPKTVNCQGNCHVTKGIEDITTMCLNFSKRVYATVQNSWLDPRKVREMTIVGSRRMIVYDDVQPLEKIRIYDMRVETPPHYDSFAEFQYSYHYGDSYIPYVQQDEPLKIEAQHFLDCIRNGETPLTDGKFGADVVRVLEASSHSLRANGGAIDFATLSELSAIPAGRRTVSPASAEVHAGNGNGNGNGHASVARA